MTGNKQAMLLMKPAAQTPCKTPISLCTTCSPATLCSMYKYMRTLYNNPFQIGDIVRCQVDASPQPCLINNNGICCRRAQALFTPKFKPKQKSKSIHRCLGRYFPRVSQNSEHKNNILHRVISKIPSRGYVQP